jgi:hypothetical protein
MDSVNKQNTEDLKSKLNDFINKSEDSQKDCQGEECFIRQPQDVIERVEKKYITNDGRQLLI